MKAWLVLVLVVACSTPALKLDLAVPDDGSCGETSCAAIKLSCKAVASIRIIDPEQPGAPYISQCERVTEDKKHDLCSVAQLKLSQDTPLPEKTLEVQFVLYPEDQLPIDPVTGDPICPTEKEGLAFDATTGTAMGSIVMQDLVTPSRVHVTTPAVGGRAFWHPGDSNVVVPLACNNLGALDDPTCAGENSNNVTATVADFDTGLAITNQLATQLTLRVGEPSLRPGSTDVDFVLDPSTTRPLLQNGTDPVWGAAVDLTFAKTACIEVLQDGPQETVSLTCKPVTSGADVSINAFRLAKASLDNVLAATGETSLVKGMTVGIVVDYLFLPAPAGLRITATAPNQQPVLIEYLDNFGTAIAGTSATGQTTTSSSRFLSRDAPYGTVFATSSGQDTVTFLGGLVAGKVTVVVLQLPKPPDHQ